MSDENTGTKTTDKPDETPVHWAELLGQLENAGAKADRLKLMAALLRHIGGLERRANELRMMLMMLESGAQAEAPELDDSEARRRQLALGGLLSGIMGDDPTVTSDSWNTVFGRVLSHLVRCAIDIGMDDAVITELDERKAVFLAAREPAETEEPK